MQRDIAVQGSEKETSICRRGYGDDELEALSFCREMKGLEVRAG